MTDRDRVLMTLAYQQGRRGLAQALSSAVVPAATLRADWLSGVLAKEVSYPWPQIAWTGEYVEGVGHSHQVLEGVVLPRAEMAGLSELLREWEQERRDAGR